MSINRVEISGNLGRDPELRSTASGMQVCTFSVCVNERRKSGGKWEDVPHWVDVTFFGNRAESISRYLSKGSLVFVAGRLRQSHWEARDGQKRSRLEVVGEDIHFGGSRRDEESYDQLQAESQGDYEANQASVYDEDIPF